WSAPGPGSRTPVTVTSPWRRWCTPAGSCPYSWSPSCRQRRDGSPRPCARTAGGCPGPSRCSRGWAVVDGESADAYGGADRPAGMEVAMSVVNTVRGPVDVTELGQTLMHEHVFVLSTEHLDNYGKGRWWDEEARVADAIAKLNALAAKGVRTIVDPTVWGLGRNIPRIQRVAAGVPDLNIIVATGLYSYEELPHQYEHRGPGLLLDMPDPMIDDFVRDITEGIADTGVKAAFLKCVVEEKGLTPGVERICRAVARAHAETGAPITVHTNCHARTGLIALDLFAKEGVDLTKVVVGHAGDTNDLDYLQRLEIGRASCRERV